MYKLEANVVPEVCADLDKEEENRGYEVEDRERDEGLHYQVYLRSVNSHFGSPWSYVVALSMYDT